jgi:hypothetical protein
MHHRVRELPAMRFTVAAALSCLIAAPAFAGIPAHPRLPYREGDVLVKYRAPAKALDAAASYGMTPKRSLMHGSVQLMKLPAFTTVAQMLEVLRADPAIEVAEPNLVRHKLAAIPNDPLFAEQWGLRNTGQPNYVNGGPPGIPGGDLHLIEAWDSDGNGTADRTGSPSVTVAIIDDGFELTHPDLAANFTAGRDLVDDDDDPSPVGDGESHGTLVAGALGAKGDNGIGVAGVAWNVRLLPLRTDFSVAAELDAIQFARDHGAQIINASYGGPGFLTTELDAIRALAGNEILFVAAAGNENSNLDRSVFGYPANLDAENIVAVAATNRQDEIASFSTYGPVSVDVAAPGLQIVTTSVGAGYTIPTGCNDDGPDGSCGVAGTSLAAPYTAGVAALIKSQYPSAGFREIKARLIEGADPGQDPANLARRRVAGGRVNAARSLALTPRPSLVLRSVVVADGNGRLDPGESTNIDLVVQNLWLSANHVVATLSAVNNAVSVNGAPQTLASLGSGQAQTMRFSVNVPAAPRPHQEVFFDLTLTADGGYSATRSFALEIAELFDGTQVSETLQTDLYDEFHTYHFDVPSTAGIGEIDFDTTSTADIDILVKRNAPPHYQYELGTPCPEHEEDPGVCYDDADVVGQNPDGNEHVVFDNPAPGTYYVTVINFEHRPDPVGYTLRAKLVPRPAGGSGNDGGSHGGGGGALDAGLLLALGMLALVRRRAQ